MIKLGDKLLSLDELDPQGKQPVAPFVEQFA
jgi:hypothetical protein